MAHGDGKETVIGVGDMRECFHPRTLLIILVALIAIAGLSGCSFHPECLEHKPVGGSCPTFKL